MREAVHGGHRRAHCWLSNGGVKERLCHSLLLLVRCSAHLLPVGSDLLHCALVRQALRPSEVPLDVVTRLLSAHLPCLLLQLLTADQVEFWHHPEKAGWMHSQGEHIKTWRKRWFVLKQVGVDGAKPCVSCSPACGVAGTDGNTAGQQSSVKGRSCPAYKGTSMAVQNHCPLPCQFSMSSPLLPPLATLCRASCSALPATTSVPPPSPAALWTSPP